MSEPAIAANQEGLGRRRGEIEKVPDEMERASGTCSLPQPGQAWAQSTQQTAASLYPLTLAAPISCAWLPLAELGSKLSMA